MSEPFALKTPGMAVVLITSTKGGSGKSTTVQTLAVAAARAGETVVVIDLDPSASISQWRDRRKADDVAVVAVPAARLTKALDVAREGGATLVIIDTAGRPDNGGEKAAREADIVLIPTRPTTKEMEAIPGTLDQLAVAGNPPAFVFFNRVHPLASTGLDQARRIAHNLGLVPMPVHLSGRIVYDTADDTGLSPQEIEPNGPAGTEAAALYRYIREFLNLGRSEQANVDEHPRSTTTHDART